MQLCASANAADAQVRNQHSQYLLQSPKISFQLLPGFNLRHWDVLFRPMQVQGRPMCQLHAAQLAAAMQRPTAAPARQLAFNTLGQAPQEHSAQSPPPLPATST
jgi:hypothetical protein